MNDYLKEANVPAIGGSWIVQQALVDAGNWDEISARAASVVASVNRG